MAPYFYPSRLFWGKFTLFPWQQDFTHHLTYDPKPQIKWGKFIHWIKEACCLISLQILRWNRSKTETNIHRSVSEVSFRWAAYTHKDSMSLLVLCMQISKFSFFMLNYIIIFINVQRSLTVDVELSYLSFILGHRLKMKSKIQQRPHKGHLILHLIHLLVCKASSEMVSVGWCRHLPVCFKKRKGNMKWRPKRA